jgi:hypothetical protein
VQDDIIPDVSEQVWRAADPSGENRALIDAARHGGDDVPLWMQRLGLDVGEAWERLMSVGVEYRRNVLGVAGAMVVLVPRGWAPTNMEAETVFHAVEMVDEGRGDEADEMLAGQWEGEGAWRLTRACQRVESMGATDPELERTFRARARLLRLAMGHHLEGRYEASIPILQAQVEGIVMDLTNGNKFFTKGRLKADLVDDSQFVSIKAGLAVLQAAYGQDVGATQAAGSLSRHGVAHGRDLAYDTRVNSAKNWSLLDGLVDWALPRARTLVQARRAERQALNAGSQETDEQGRRVDDREIAETRDALRLLQTSAMGWHAQRRVFRADLVGGVYGTDDFTGEGYRSTTGSTNGSAGTGRKSRIGAGLPRGGSWPSRSPPRATTASSSASTPGRTSLLGCHPTTPRGGPVTARPRRTGPELVDLSSESSYQWRVITPPQRAAQGRATAHLAVASMGSPNSGGARRLQASGSRDAPTAHGGRAIAISHLRRVAQWAWRCSASAQRIATACQTVGSTAG